jgi:hypothetical protein
MRLPRVPAGSHSSSGCPALMRRLIFAVLCWRSSEAQYLGSAMLDEPVRRGSPPPAEGREPPAARIPQPREMDGQVGRRDRVEPSAGAASDPGSLSVDERASQVSCATTADVLLRVGDHLACGQARAKATAMREEIRAKREGRASMASRSLEPPQQTAHTDPSRNSGEALGSRRAAAAERLAAVRQPRGAGLPYGTDGINTVGNTPTPPPEQVADAEGWTPPPIGSSSADAAANPAPPHRTPQGGGEEVNWYLVDQGGAVAFRSGPDLNARTTAVAQPDDLIFAARAPADHGNAGWIQTAEGLW